MSYTSQLQIHAKPRRLVELRNDCVELSGHDCGGCPLLGVCAIHVRMTRAMNRIYQEPRMTFVRNVTGANWSATALRESDGLVIYQVTKSLAADRRRISVPMESASDGDKLRAYIETHVAQGSTGARVLCG